MSNRCIYWRYKPFAHGWEDYEPDAFVWLDVAAIEEVWKHQGQYVGPAGSNGHGRRYANAGEWFATNGFSDMLFITINSGHVSFTDGRHRFAWLRDHGVKAIQFRTSPDQANELSRRFGTALRESVIETGDEHKGLDGVKLDQH